MSTGFNTPLTVIGSVYPVVAAADLPVSGSVGQIYAITDFGTPYVQVQWTGSKWQQVTHFHTAWASLPSATTFDDFVGYVDDDVLGHFRVIAKTTKWRLFNPLRILEYQKASGAFGPDNPVVERTLVANRAIPAGLIQLGDSFIIDSLVERSGTPMVSGGGRINVRMGTSDTPASNPVVVYTSFTGSANTSQRANVRSTILTATTALQQLGTGIGYAVGTASMITNTITDIATSGQKISLTAIAGGVAETVLPYSVSVFLESSGML